MAGKGRSGTHWKTGYTVYKSKEQWREGRRSDLKAHVAANPNDLVAANALKNIGSATYRRKAPNNKGGWLSGKGLFAIIDYVGREGKKKGFTGQRARGTMMKLAHYLRMSKKVTNEMQHASKDDRHKKSLTAESVSNSKTSVHAQKQK